MVSYLDRDIELIGPTMTCKVSAWCYNVDCCMQNSISLCSLYLCKWLGKECVWKLMGENLLSINLCEWYWIWFGERVIYNNIYLYDIFIFVYHSR